MTTNQNTDGSEPVALYGFLTAKDGHHEQLGALLAQLVEPSRSHRGSLVYRLHEQPDGRFFLYELWASRAALAAHHGTQVLQDVLARLPEHLAGAPEAYEGWLFGEPVSSAGTRG
ncbi:putative quinol monooxygenase [Streptomyces sp. TLI_171]|uniref:putative quinol monooxygenase n=1 Tax=Streptomyces sp. TLI_171 TaxID=1938859 RepID=UPI000C1749C5|nr:putative quinol monooxygenase [Streptomyces sp. TLI_171]RKE23162.1 quinol monooxygenase YgiN [Streptomyces sp. TLI_171]